METSTSILVVDDDREIRNLLTDFLGANSFRAHAAADGPTMWSMLEEHPIDLIVLDLNLPGEDGLALCRKLRTRSTTPVIMLTARGEPIDRILGLEMGADDYLAKPFEPRELIARIKSVLRRTHALPPNMENPETHKNYHFAGWVLDMVARHLVSPQGTLVMLSGAEFRLLKVFLEHANRVLSRDQLMNLAKGRDAEPFDRAIDLQVSRLRQKLGDDAKSPTLLKTVRNEGYILSVPVQAET